MGFQKMSYTFFSYIWNFIKLKQDKLFNFCWYKIHGLQFKIPKTVFWIFLDIFFYFNDCFKKNTLKWSNV